MNKFLTASLIGVSMFTSANMMATEVGNDSVDFNDKEQLLHIGREYLFDNDTINDSMALAFLNQAVELGCWKSADLLGSYHYHKNGSIAPRNSEQAVCFFKKAKELGSPLAEYSIKEISPLLTLCDSIDTYEKQVVEGDVNAMNRLATAYFNGAGVIENDEKALEYIRQAAENGDMNAKRNLGMYYYMGEIVPQDISLGVSLIEEAANAGDPTSQFFMACFYVEAMPFRKDNAKALEWYEKALAQNQQNALYNTAIQYYAGTLRKQDYAMAVKYFEKAASLGHAKANSMLASCYLYGFGVEKDVTKAIEYYKKSVELGCVGSLEVLGDIHLFTEFGICDIAEARKWYDIASCYNINVDNKLYFCSIASDFNQIKQQAEQGVEDCIYDMIKCYRMGIVVKQDRKEAIKWAEKLVLDYEKNGMLGNIYFRMEKPDYKKAFNHYKLAEMRGLMCDVETAIEYSRNIKKIKKAAVNGDAEALYNLAFCYDNGYGVKACPFLAEEYYLRAADAGNESAMLEVAYIWERKEGVGAKYNYWIEKYENALSNAPFE